MMNHRDGSGPRPGMWMLWGFLAFSAYYVLSEHRVHAIEYLPFLMLALCPLMHLFMHRGHGGCHGNEEGGTPRPRGDENRRSP